MPKERITFMEKENNEQTLINKKKDFYILTKESIQEKIYIVRGEKVMLDFELAEIYGYETRYLNRQVKNNKDKFEGFMFQLTNDEYCLILKCKNFTSSWGGKRKLPYAFTEQGIYMLMTVLKGPLAIEQSRKLVTIFKEMKDYIVDSNHLLTTDGILKLLGNTVNRHDKDIEDIKNQLVVIMDNFIDPSKHKETLIMNGQKYEADLAYQEIFKTAKKSIVLIDDYVSIKTLDLFRVCSSKINIHIYSDDVNKQLTTSLLEDYINETNIKMVISPSNSMFHDRYIFIDEKYVYVSGSSIKDAGNKICTIIKSDDYELYKQILDKLGYK